jgi:hypothetical protein
MTLACTLVTSLTTTSQCGRLLESEDYSLEDIPRPTDASGCLEISLRCFSSESKLERQSRSSAARTTWLACEGPFRYCPPVQCVGSALMEVADPEAVCRHWTKVQWRLPIKADRLLFCERDCGI